MVVRTVALKVCASVYRLAKQMAASRAVYLAVYLVDC
jgi:hypothetical protein